MVSRVATLARRRIPGPGLLQFRLGVTSSHCCRLHQLHILESTGATGAIGPSLYVFLHLNSLQNWPL